MRRTLILAFLLALTPAAALPGQTAGDSAAIRETALNYVEGWYEGSAERMTRALHPDLAKRIVRGSRDSSRLSHMTAAELIDGTRRGGGTRTPREQQQKDVVILDIFGNTASVKATMSGWVDYMHLARWNGEWRIVNVLWELKPRS